jgi:hypothetical protein
MEGSLHTASFAKTAAALVGYVTRADLGAKRLRTTTTAALRVFLIREVGGAISASELEGFHIQTDCLDLMNVIAGAGTFTVLNAATRVTVTLI